MCEEVTVCLLRCVAVAVYRNCSLWELRCMAGVRQLNCG